MPLLHNQAESQQTKRAQGRKCLQHHYNIRKDILTVLSDEMPSAPRPPEPVVDPGRPRALNGTINYMPPLFGFVLAGAVIQRLLRE